jgi:transcriptional regulator NrdR family protein
MVKKYQLNNRKTVFVTKANGKKVPFNSHKVVVTCIRAGANRKLAKKVSNEISSKIHDGMSTHEVYRLVLASLSQFE